MCKAPELPATLGLVMRPIHARYLAITYYSGEFILAEGFKGSLHFEWRSFGLLLRVS